MIVIFTVIITIGLIGQNRPVTSTVQSWKFRFAFKRTTVTLCWTKKLGLVKGAIIRSELRD